MFLTVKFQKCRQAVYISHIDLQRAVNRTIKRAGIQPLYSQGFNPHPLLKFSVPLPLGIRGEAEYFTIAVEHTNVADFCAQCNRVAPPGLIFDRVWMTEKAPNLAGKAASARYRFDVSLTEEEFEGLTEYCRSALTVEHKNKKGERSLRPAAALVGELERAKDCFYAELATGKETLRADRFADAIGAFLPKSVGAVDIARDKQYVEESGCKITFDDYLDALVREETI